jgi:hypothetical protein
VAVLLHVMAMLAGALLLAVAVAVAVAVLLHVMAMLAGALPH